MSNKVRMVVQNAGLVELYKVVLKLYNKNLITKDDIKEFHHNLKVLTDTLPEAEERFLH